MLNSIRKLTMKINNFFKKSPRLAMLVVFILEFIIGCLVVGFTRYDGEYFIKKSQEMSLKEFTIMRYNTWSSRNIIEYLSCIILRWPTWLWALTNALINTLTIYLILKLFVKKDEKKYVWITISFVLLYPMYEIASVGWGVGTINYTWVLAMLLLAIMPIKKMFNNEKVSKFMYIIYSLALIFACNQEQVCVVTFCIYLFFTIEHILSKPKKINKFLVFQLLITILSLIFIITCPGNYVRKNDEIRNYYIDYNSLGFFDKCTLGIISTMNSLVTGRNIVFLAFAIILVCCVFKNYNNKLYRIISLIPIISITVLGFGKEIVLNAFPYLSIYMDAFEKTNLYLFTDSYLDIINYIPIIVDLVILGSIILSLLLIFKNIKNNIAILTFTLGLISRVMMGFSPTVFASSDRTFLFFDFALIINCVLLWQEYSKDDSLVKSNGKLELFYYSLAILQYLHVLIFVLTSI